MSKIKRYEVAVGEPVYAALNDENNSYITETAGFVPLEVKLKQFEENGIQMQFNTKEFTSSDYRDIYLSPDFEITPEDDYEDIQEKLKLRNEFIAELQKKKAQSDGVEKPAAPVTTEGGTDDPMPQKEAVKSE